MNFQDKVCVITGGANGIGRCIVEEFLKAGAYVAFNDIDSESAEKLILTYGHEKLLFVSGDIAEEETIIHFAEEVKKRFDHIDFLINNACMSKGGILSDCSFDDFNYTLRVGVTAPYMLSKLLMDYFSLDGAIINIASTRAFMSQPDTESYSAAKGGIIALTHALSSSLAGKVRVNAISPGWIDTGAYQKEKHYTPKYTSADMLQHPAGRVGEPLDIAKMVLFLCSNAGSFIAGENITIDGGMSKQMIYHDDQGWTFNPHKAR
ncbi:NAD(P)-dependent dehydrogenase (short-subunit alcohol dehydrogenase family) [Paenibacillus cellulosilyticus]|uniref:NAD(P)-dependent dehydrogenase (Short-subunit alcohol dehydrogenase family) n=1 Tax=Paenibacillus cellulosilyticus TaxID=375489 RepID=A0A2V2YUH0_9BACL|nr:SDR family oxidoreductase [Paenibacillus cellulosilyticus]PWW02732.1 NAD(P)-dependent dehydrogenase (short-subunit alcohol dehydrogenase family) [Paenibacillus cellulosilyticus]QKS45659.1 SDR family oxidoreductase [Paenibacillus cellulosilyticus]